MKASSMLGLSVGWALTATAVAIDVGTHDPLFLPALAMVLPASVGVFSVLRTRRQQGDKAEPLEGKRVIGFAVLGGVLVMLAVLAIIAGMFWNKPPPGSEPDGEVLLNGQPMEVK